jgi:uncharacterized protein
MPPKSSTQSGKKLATKSSARQSASAQPQEPPPIVGGRWLIYAVLGVVAFAAVCAYLTVCLLFYQGQWQIVFHPSRNITTTPATLGLKCDAISFDYTGTGAAQLSGWWIPAEPGAPQANRTLLYMRDGRGSLSDSAAQLKTLHSLGINIFAFDYRGFGQSMDTHPSESRVYEDADAAWTYLTDIRRLDPHSIVLYGTGLGATIAAETALRHRESPGLVLENPAPPALSLIAADERTSIIPIRWLFRDRFEILPKLQTLGIELNQANQAVLLNNKPASSFEIVRQENHSTPKFLLFLGVNPSADPHYLLSWQQFLAE